MFRHEKRFLFDEDAFNVHDFVKETEGLGMVGMKSRTLMLCTF